MPLRMLAAAVLALASGVGPMAHAQNQPAPDAVTTHPAEVALVDEGALGFVYRQFPSGLRLYIREQDPPGRSTCDQGCAAAWPPVIAPQDAQPLGLWSIAVRPDGSRQWAFRGKPIYTRFHDSPSEATGTDRPGWRIVGYSDEHPEAMTPGAQARAAETAATEARAIESLPATAR